MENLNNTLLPIEVSQIAENVSIEKRNEVQNVLNFVFNGVSKMKEQLDSVNVVDENDKVNMKLANTIRLGVRQVRLDAEKVFDSKRAEVQAQMISFKTEDQLWLKAKQTMQILTKEIEENARWKEETKLRFDAEQKELKIQQRIISVSKFDSSILRTEFENMSDESFNKFLSIIEQDYNNKIEAEKKAEQERLAKEKEEKEEQERIKAENERLKKEAEAKEKQLAEERLKAEQERKAIEEKARKEREESDRIAKEERLKQEAILKAEREAKEKLEAEIKAKKELEIKAENERKKAELLAKKEAEKLAKAPIKEQLNKWVDSFEIQDFESNDVSDEIKTKFISFKKWAKEKINEI